MTIELYDYFVQQGHEVEIFTNTVSPKLEEYLFEKNIRFSTPSSFVIMEEYDLVWVQHQNIPDAFFDRNPLVGNWIFHHMSPFEPLCFTLNAEFENSLSDLILTNSPETREKLGSLGIDLSKVETLGNPAPLEFFNFPEDNKSNSYFLFVSNHPPVEIIEAMEILSRKEIQFIHLGMGSPWAVSRRVTPRDIAGASVVISIGKTIQYSLAMNKRIFIYDYFGGDGFISSVEKFKENAFYNFSGRNSRNIKSSSEIVSELINFVKNGSFLLESIKDADLETYNLPLRIQGILNGLNFTKKSAFFTSLDPRNVEVFRGALQSLRRSIIQESELLKLYTNAIAERDSAIAERDSAIAERDGESKNL